MPWARFSKNFGQSEYLVVAEMFGHQLDLPRKPRGECALRSLLKFGYRFHQSPSNVEWCHADVDVEHDPPEGGTSGGVESLESEKHLTEGVVLAVLLPGEKVAVLPSSDCLGGCTLLYDKVEGGNKGLEIQLSLSELSVTVPVLSKFR